MRRDAILALIFAVSKIIAILAIDKLTIKQNTRNRNIINTTY